MARKCQYPHTEAELNQNDWEEVTEEHYDDLLGALPPERQSGWAFAVGEPLSQLNDGRIVHDMLTKVDGRYYAKPYPLADFNPAAFEAAIRAQLSK